MLLRLSRSLAIIPFTAFLLGSNLIPFLSLDIFLGDHAQGLQDLCNRALYKAWIFTLLTRTVLITRYVVKCSLLYKAQIVPSACYFLYFCNIFYNFHLGSDTLFSYILKKLEILPGIILVCYQWSQYLAGTIQTCNYFCIRRYIIFKLWSTLWITL